MSGSVCVRVVYDDLCNPTLDVRRENSEAREFLHNKDRNLGKQQNGQQEKRRTGTGVHIQELHDAERLWRQNEARWIRLWLRKTRCKCPCENSSVPFGRAVPVSEVVNGRSPKDRGDNRHVRNTFGGDKNYTAKGAPREDHSGYSGILHAA